MEHKQCNDRNSLFSAAFAIYIQHWMIPCTAIYKTIRSAKLLENVLHKTFAAYPTESMNSIANFLYYQFYDHIYINHLTAFISDLLDEPYISESNEWKPPYYERYVDMLSSLRLGTIKHLWAHPLHNEADEIDPASLRRVYSIIIL